jgi:hypothetical protein
MGARVGAEVGWVGRVRTAWWAGGTESAVREGLAAETQPYRRPLHEEARTAGRRARGTPAGLSHIAERRPRPVSLGRLDQPLMAPDMKPRTYCPCSAKKRIKQGSAITTTPASNEP